MWFIFGTVAGHFDIQNISFTVSQVGWNIQSTHEKNNYNRRYSGIQYTWYSLPCWKSNPSIFVKSTVARWQLLQGEEKILSFGKWTVLQVKFVKWHDMIVPRHFVTNDFKIPSLSGHKKYLSHNPATRPIHWWHCSPCHTNFALQSHSENTVVSTWNMFLQPLNIHHLICQLFLNLKHLKSYHLPTLTKRSH